MAKMTAAQRYAHRKFRQLLAAKKRAEAEERLAHWREWERKFGHSRNDWALTAETRNAWIQHNRQGGGVV